jgi:hypothetical protein
MCALQGQTPWGAGPEHRRREPGDCPDPPNTAGGASSQDPTGGQVKGKDKSKGPSKGQSKGKENESTNKGGKRKVCQS